VDNPLRNDGCGALRVRRQDLERRHLGSM